MKRWVWILLALNVALIWGNSALPSKASHSISDWVVFGVERVFEGPTPSAASSKPAVQSAVPSQATSSAASSAGASSAGSSSAASSKEPVIYGSDNPTVKDRLETSENTKWLRTAVRKTAHVTEYLTMGLLMALALGGVFPLREKGARLLLLGGGVALLDETIQIFSKRTSSVSDVWIDLAGFVAGCLLWELIRFWKAGRAKDE